MDTTVFFVILLATIMHAIWNAMVKHHPDKAIAVLAIVLGHIPLALICILYFPLPGKESLPYIIASVLAHQGYQWYMLCLLYTSPSPRDCRLSRMPSSA